jgi:hypothetical protein
LGFATRLAEHEECIRYAYHIIRDLGAEPELLAALVESPWFSTALVVAGVGYLIFVGEPDGKVQRHPAWPIAAWSIVAICAALVFSVIGYGYFQLRVLEVASPKIDEIQKRALGGQVFWHLTDAQKLKLGDALDQVPEGERFEVKLLCLPTSSNSQTYATDLFQVCSEHHWKVAPNCMFNNVRRDFVGLSVSIPTKFNRPGATNSDLPHQIQKLAELFTAADIAGSWSFNDEQKDEEALLVIGNNP